jgi:hypothetical protein
MGGVQVRGWLAPMFRSRLLMVVRRTHGQIDEFCLISYLYLHAPQISAKGHK